MTIREALDLIPHVRRTYGTENFTRDSYTASLWFEIVEKALKAQDRPIICPRCGRTFAESEGRGSEE